MHNIESNQGQDGYKEIQQTQEVKALLNRFGIRKYTKANRPIKQLATIASYGFNIISILLAFKGLTWLLSWMIEGTILCRVIAFFTLLLIEIAKRWSSDVFWDAYESRKVILKLPLAMLLLFFILSGISTGGGAYLEVIRLSEGKADVIIETTDPELVGIQSRLDSIDNMIATMKNTRWRGTVTQDANKNIQLMLPTQTNLIASRQTRKQQIWEHNQLALVDHNISVGWIALAVFFLCLFFEVAFEGTMWYRSHYDFRSLCEQLGKSKAIDLFTNNQDEAMITYLNQPKAAPLQVAQQEGQQRKIGFVMKGATGGQQAQETSGLKQPKSLVKQGVTEETSKKKTLVSSSEKQARETGETVVPIDSNVKYLKQKCRQAYKRKMIQEDPTTPEKNYKQLKSHLEILGYQVKPTPQEGSPYYVAIFKPTK